MPAAQNSYALIAHVLFETVQQLGIFPEKLVTDVGTLHRGVLLVLAIDHLVHPAFQQSVLVVGQDLIPPAAPDHLDHVPAGSAKNGFQLLDDFSVAANWAIQPLEVAIHNEDQIV